MADIKKISAELERLYAVQSKLSRELSDLNIKSIDAGKKVERIDAEIGHGHRRVDELARAKDDEEKIRELRNRKNEEYFAALETYEAYHSEHRDELMQSVIDLFNEIQPLHNELIKKVNAWRDGLSFVNRFYIGRGFRKEYGFFVPSDRAQPESIFTGEDENAIVVLEKILNGEIEIEPEKRTNIYSQVKPRRRGTVHV